MHTWLVDINYWVTTSMCMTWWSCEPLISWWRLLRLSLPECGWEMPLATFWYLPASTKLHQGIVHCWSHATCKRLTHSCALYMPSYCLSTPLMSPQGKMCKLIDWLVWYRRVHCSWEAGGGLCQLWPDRADLGVWKQLWGGLSILLLILSSSGSRHILTCMHWCCLQLLVQGRIVSWIACTDAACCC